MYNYLYDKQNFKTIQPFFFIEISQYKYQNINSNVIFNYIYDIQGYKVLFIREKSEYLSFKCFIICFNQNVNKKLTDFILFLCNSNDYLWLCYTCECFTCKFIEYLTVYLSQNDFNRKEIRVHCMYQSDKATLHFLLYFLCLQ